MNDVDVINIVLHKSYGKIDEAMNEFGYKNVGEFLYDYPPLPHKWSSRIRTEMYKKDDQLWYLMNADADNNGRLTDLIRIGKVDRQKDNNPEYRMT